MNQQDNQSIISAGISESVSEVALAGFLDDLTVQNAEVITGGPTIRVHYDTGFGNSIQIRGSEAPAN